jgi:hypothetical protein
VLAGSPQVESPRVFFFSPGSGAPDGLVVTDITLNCCASDGNTPGSGPPKLGSRGRFKSTC